jgi:hypothetical protein
MNNRRERGMSVTLCSNPDEIQRVCKKFLKIQTARLISSGGQKVPRKVVRTQPALFVKSQISRLWWKHHQILPSSEGKQVPEGIPSPRFLLRA